MDERVKDLLERVRLGAASMGEAAGVTARYAGKCATQMVDVAKLNMKIFDLKTEINDLKQSIGGEVYATHRGSEGDSGAIDTMLTQLDEKHAAIDELKERIGVLKNAKDCPVCGVACGKNDKFCKECGAAL